MIRRLIILLLIVGCVFGETIVYERALLGFKEEATILKATIIKIENGELWYEQELFFGKNIDTIPCEKIIQLISSDGREIEFDCSKNRYQESTKKVSANNETPSSFSESEINTAKLGGIFIAIGGGLLITNMDSDIDGTDDLDSWEGRQKIGYGLITIGGVLIAIGI